MSQINETDQERRLRYNLRKAAYNREWRKRNGTNGKINLAGIRNESARKSRRKWGQRYPEKVRAHLIVYKALHSGTLIKQSCFCGSTIVHAHHHNGYDRPLDVVWLCPTHHREIHGLNLR